MDDPCLAVEQPAMAAAAATVAHATPITRVSLRTPLGYSGGADALITKSEYVAALGQDKTQFLPDGMMPASGPQVVEAIGRLGGTITGSVDLSTTYTNTFVIAANKAEGFTG